MRDARYWAGTGRRTAGHGTLDPDAGGRERQPRNEQAAKLPKQKLFYFAQARLLICATVPPSDALSPARNSRVKAARRGHGECGTQTGRVLR